MSIKKISALFIITAAIILICSQSCSLFTDKELGSYLKGTWKGTYSVTGTTETGPAVMTFYYDNTGKLDLNGGLHINKFTITDGDGETIKFDFDTWNTSNGEYYYSMSEHDLSIDDFKYYNGMFTLTLQLAFKK